MGNSKSSKQVAKWFQAAQTGDDHTMALLLTERPSLMNEFNHEGWTALHLVSKLGYDKVVALLLAEKPAFSTFVQNPSVKDSTRYNVDQHGWNALHLAVGYGHERVVVQLLAANPNLANAADFLGRTPFHIALRFSQEKMVAMLQGQLSFDELARIAVACKKSQEPFVLAMEMQCECLVHLLNQDVARIVFGYIGSINPLRHRAENRDFH